MTEEEQRLIRKGQGEPIGGLAQQARASHVLWEKHAEALARNGFTAEEGARLKTLADELDSAESKTADARGRAVGRRRRSARR